MKDKEIARLNNLKEIDNYYFKNGIKYLAGIDEAGRGPLAGPVVVRLCDYAGLFFFRGS